MIQALCLNGDCKRALLTYWEHLALQKGGYSTAPEVLCEMVRGLCRHGLVNEAYEVLSKAQAGSRNIHVWNTYLDGLVRHPQKILKEYASRFYERFDDAVQSMRSKDSIEPDAVTWSMWMRACFLMGDWRGAYKCFRDQYGVMSTDVACWDTVIRGLFQFSSDEPHAVGWQLVEEFIAMTSEKSPNKDSRAVVAADSRIVETVLLHCFPRFNEAKGTSAYKVLSEDVFERVVVWIEANISPRRKIGHALVLGTLLKTGQIKAALAMHQNMIDRQLWPSKSINCMVAKALALAGSRQASLGSTASAIEQAEEFILRKVPKQHYAAAYLPLVKSAAQDRRYADMWILIDRHYPWVPKQGAALADTARPFPDADMYQAMLSATEAKGDWSENRRLLDKLRLHLDLVNDCGDKKPKKKMAGIYNHYIRKHV
ncbi:hypothetical protein LPJ56_002096 [Coemansia sp. RSA 2599]|nr:hypothetical protein LPJ56_002096 [Coemansia sp. RSA 2599]